MHAVGRVNLIHNKCHLHKKYLFLFSKPKRLLDLKYTEVGLIFYLVYISPAA